MAKELRNKTGLSQAQLASYLGVSKGLINLVERGERSLNGEANLKLAFLAAQVYKDEQDNETAAQLQSALVEEWKIKEIKYHEAKINELHLKIHTLEKKLARLKDNYTKATARLKLLSGRGENGNGTIKPNAADGHWFTIMCYNTEKEIRNSGPEMQHPLETELKVLIRYEEVHRKMLEELVGKV